MYKDAHHVIFTKHDWASRPQSLAIRNTPSLIVKMTREEHNVIHRNVPGIPVPSYHVLARIASNFVRTPDTLETIDNLMFATDEAIRNPKAHDVERTLGQLTIQALEEQRPFLADILGVTR